MKNLGHWINGTLVKGKSDRWGPQTRKNVGV